ncbi:MAG: type II toxin-antitoxin system VapC family toxin [Thermoplasmatota archaeon]
MPAVVFDTNALLLPFTSGVRVEEEIERLMGPSEWLVPSCVAWELERLAKGKGASARAARMAQKLAQRATAVPARLPGDDGVLEVAHAHHAALFTNDRRLQAEAARRGLTVLVARASGQLAFLGSGSHPHA